MKSWIAAVVLAPLTVLACVKADTASTQPPPVENDPPAGDPPADPTQAAAECESDADCIVTCERIDNCCDQLCGPCEQVYTRAEMDQVAANKQTTECAATSCPVAKCMAPKEETFGVCNAGTCELGRRPIAAP